MGRVARLAVTGQASLERNPRNTLLMVPSLLARYNIASSKPPNALALCQITSPPYAVSKPPRRPRSSRSFAAQKLPIWHNTRPHRDFEHGDENVQFRAVGFAGRLSREPQRAHQFSFEGPYQRFGDTRFPFHGRHRFRIYPVLGRGQLPSPTANGFLHGPWAAVMAAVALKYLKYDRAPPRGVSPRIPIYAPSRVLSLP
jgi:hypothetical protein